MATGTDYVPGRSTPSAETTLPPNRLALSVHDTDTIVEVAVGTLLDSAVTLTFTSGLDGPIVVAFTGPEARWLIARLLKQMRGA